MVIHESAEDYLESILVLRERRGMVRSIDIVNELGYSNVFCQVKIPGFAKANSLVLPREIPGNCQINSLVLPRYFTRMRALRRR